MTLVSVLGALVPFLFVLTELLQSAMAAMVENRIDQVDRLLGSLGYEPRLMGEA